VVADGRQAHPRGRRVDRAYIAAGGFGTAALGFAGLTQLHPHSPIAFLLVCAAIYAGGIVGVMTVGNELVMGAVPPGRAGAAAAVVETATEFGAALGIAVLGSIGGAVTVAGQLPGRIGTGLVEAARAAFTHGLNNAALGAAIVMVLAAAASAVFFRGVQVGSPPTVAGEQQAQEDKELATR
jgi:DHA2 family multidrug resistance protein-like MFS transporter